MVAVARLAGEFSALGADLKARRREGARYSEVVVPTRAGVVRLGDCQARFLPRLVGACLKRYQAAVLRRLECHHELEAVSAVEAFVVSPTRVARPLWDSRNPRLEHGGSTRPTAPGTTRSRRV